MKAKQKKKPTGWRERALMAESALQLAMATLKKDDAKPLTNLADARRLMLQEYGVGWGLDRDAARLWVGCKNSDGGKFILQDIPNDVVTARADAIQRENRPTDYDKLMALLTEFGVEHSANLPRGIKAVFCASGEFRFYPNGKFKSMGAWE